MSGVSVATDSTADADQCSGSPLFYLYAILEPSSALLAAVELGAIAGIVPAEPVRAVAAAGLIAAISVVPEDTFGEEALNAAIGDMARLAPLTVRHQQAVHALWQETESIIPITFGAVYRNVTGIERLLQDDAPRLRALLHALRGKEEWGVRVLLAPQQLDAAVVRRSPLLQQLAAEQAAAGPGRAYLLQRRRERALVTERARIAAELIEMVTATLSARAEGVQAGVIGTLAGSDPLVAANLSFLVDGSGREAFRTAIDNVSAQVHDAGVLLERSGPWAAYSFVRVQTVRLQPE